MNAATTARLYSAVAAAAPTHGVSVGVAGDPTTVRVDFAPGATDAQRAAAAAVVAGFDWSDAAQSAWEAGRSRADAATLIADFRAVPIAVRACMLVIHGSLNEIRARVGLPAVAEADAMAAILTLIDSGAAG